MTDYQQFSFPADGSWHNTGVSVSNGQRLSIVPSIASNGSNALPSLTSVSVPARDGLNTGISLVPGQTVTINASGLWKYNQNSIGPNGNSSYPTHDFTLPSAPAWSLIGRVGSGGWFFIGSSLTFSNTGSGELTLVMNDNQYWDNTGSLSVEILAQDSDCGVKARIGGGAPFLPMPQFDDVVSSSGDVELATTICEDSTASALLLVDAPAEPNHDTGCPEAHDGAAAPASGNPIKLRNGNKVLDVVDLSLQSSVSPFIFQRYYNQAKQSDSRYQFMGLGWSHNHRYTLVFTGSAPNRTAAVYLPDGGNLKLEEDSGNQGHFDPLAGSTSTLDYVSGDDEYLLTLQDLSQMVFDGTSLRLIERRWINGDVWSYAYDGSGNLTSVDDGYGRQLQFTYINNSGQFNHGQLWRVGDQDATGLGGSTPAGRYIEFGYTPEKNNGTTIASPKALLASVRDVRGSVWTYDYYGQHSGENISGLLNFLTKRLSPTVDTTGDGSADGSLTLESLSYTLDGSDIASITQQRGNNALETIYDFQFLGKNVTRERTAGKSTIQHFANGVYVGAANPKGKALRRVFRSVFRSQAVIDANDNETQLEWSSDGKHLEGITDALNHETGFTYDSDGRPQSILDAEERLTTFFYDADQRQPVLMTVSDSAEEIDINGSMEVNSGWSGVNSPTTNARSSTEVDTGEYSRHVEAAAANEGIQSADWDWVADHTYLIVARVYPVSGVVKMQVTGTSAFDQTSTGTGSWQTLRALSTPSSGTTGKKLQFVASGGAAEFYVDSVHILDIENLLRVYEVRYDDMARSVFEASLNPADATVLEQITRTYYMTGDGNGLLESVTQHDLTDPGNNVSTTFTYDSAGRVVKTQQSSMFGSCEVSYTVYDDAGNVVASICNYVNPGSAPTDVSEAIALYDEDFPTVNRVTTYEYDALGRRISTTLNAGASFAQTDLTVYDALDRVIRSIVNYVEDVSITQPYTAAHNLFDHGTDNTDNLVTDMVYNQRGFVRKQTDPLGNVTLFGYDNADRLVKTIVNASVPTYNNDYSGTGFDPDLSAYTASDGADEDIITEYAYDAAGNLVQTIDPLGMVSFMVYDALNRPVKTVTSAKDAATIEYDANHSSYNAANDPRSASYSPSSAADRDLIETIEYDAMGRIRRVQDTLGRWTLFGYDAQGRQVKVIRSASNPTYDIAADPDLSAYSASSDADQDIILLNQYDDNSRILYNEVYPGTTLQRRVWNAYDGLGRQFRSVVNAVGTATDGGTGDPRSATYSASSDSDKDLIGIAYYDSDGRIYRSDDTRGNTTLYGHDEIGRRVKTVMNASNPTYNVAGDPDLSAYTPGSDSDQDITASIVYDSRGRVWKSIDQAGIETRFEYDVLNRPVKTTYNYVDGTFNPAAPDEDLIETVTYDLAGRVLTTTDVRGTQTAVAYDDIGRPLTLTRAANSPLASTDYTVYDKGGRVLRMVENWIDDPEQPTPDERDGGDWLFNPTPRQQGRYRDRNLVLNFTYDKLGRLTQTADPLEHANTTTYFKDGQVESVTDPLGVVTQYRYDELRRLTRVVENFVSNGEDPEDWLWDDTIGQKRWEKSGGTAIAHGSSSDQNIIVDVTYDKAGRIIEQRDPLGRLTTYDYDLLDRRTELTNPLNKTWATAYADLMGGGSRVTLTDPNTVNTQGDFDRLGRPASIAYGDPSTTPDVTFDYSAAGVLTKMSEWSGASFTSRIRETTYSYDDLRRLTSAGFDTDGNGSVNETVSYEYDAGGLRTKLTLPGSLNVTYTYDAKGQLVSLSDWDSQTTQFAYDSVGGHIATTRANGLRSRYAYDAAGRLRSLRHGDGSRTLAQFDYEVDARGNRTRATEALAHPTTSSDTTLTYDDDAILYTGTWTDDAPFMVTDGIAASLKLLFFGDQATLTVGTGPDHGLFDVYIDKTLWHTFDGYAASTGTRAISIDLDGNGPHVLEIRNTGDKHLYSTGTTLRFQQLVITDMTYDLHTVGYGYDGLSRLSSADYYAGDNMGGAVFRQYDYVYDVAGNRLNESVALNGGSPTVSSYTYNAANQITNSGFTYDDNGNLTHDGIGALTWDRANRLLSYGGASYAYDGASNRVRQTVGTDVTNYLLDLQPGLPVFLSETTGSNVTRYLHGPRGIHAQKDASSSWEWMLQDGLGSVRGMSNNALGVLWAGSPAPYGAYFGEVGTRQSPYLFTGEYTASTGLVHLRTRDYNPALGVFTNRDPFEGSVRRPMSLNGYSWVEGNAPNMTDASGMCPQNPWWNDFPGQRCVWLANELSRQYNIPLGVLMQKDVVELEGMYALGNLNNTIGNAAILPSLFYHNPQVALQAIQQYLSGCNSGVVLAGGAVVDSRLAFVGLALIAVLAISTAAGYVARTYTSTRPEELDDPDRRWLQNNPGPEPRGTMVGWPPDTQPRATSTPDDDDILHHYTDAIGANEISRSRVIRANRNNLVYVTRVRVSPEEAFYTLFAANPRYEGKGSYVVEFRPNEDVTFYGLGEHPAVTQPNELVHIGSLREGRHMTIIYIGPNLYQTSEE